jgi:transcriptional regulator with XRE-family HTH domain
MTKQEVLHMLEQYVGHNQTAANAAKRIGISETELSLVRNEEREPTVKILDALGLEKRVEKTVTYHFKKK